MSAPLADQYIMSSPVEGKESTEEITLEQCRCDAQATYADFLYSRGIGEANSKEKLEANLVFPANLVYISGMYVGSGCIRKMFNYFLFVLLLLCSISALGLSSFESGVYSYDQCSEKDKCIESDGISTYFIEVFTNAECGDCFAWEYMFSMFSNAVLAALPFFAMCTIAFGWVLFKDELFINICSSSKSSNPVCAPVGWSNPAIKFCVLLQIFLYLLFASGLIARTIFQQFVIQDGGGWNHKTNLENVTLITANIIRLVVQLLAQSVITSFMFYMLSVLDVLKYRIQAIIDMDSSLTVKEHFYLILILNELQDYICRIIQGWSLAYIALQCFWSAAHFIWLSEHGWNGFSMIITGWFIPFFMAIVFLCAVASYNYDVSRLINAAGGGISPGNHIALIHRSVDQKVRKSCGRKCLRKSSKDKFEGKPLNNNWTPGPDDVSFLLESHEYTANHLPYFTLGGIIASYESSLLVLLIWTILLVPGLISTQLSPQS